MIEEITGTALKTLLAQGTGWLVAVLLGMALVIIVKRYEAMNEKRFEEFKAVLEAINRSSDALATMKLSVDARTEAINQLVGGFANLVRDKERGEAQWNGVATDLRQRLEDIQRRVP